MGFKNFIESMFWFQQTRPQTTIFCLTIILNSNFKAVKQELSGTKAYKEVSAEENSVVNDQCGHLPLKFSVNDKDRQDKLPTMYWLPKRHKKPHKIRFIANSSSCTTTELLNY